MLLNLKFYFDWTEVTLKLLKMFVKQRLQYIISTFVPGEDYVTFLFHTFASLILVIYFLHSFLIYWR